MAIKRYVRVLESDESVARVSDTKAEWREVDVLIDERIPVATSIALETPSGTVNGTNDDFVFTSAPKAVFLNGILQDAGAGEDYTLSGATVTFNTPPESGDKVRGLV